MATVPTSLAAAAWDAPAREGAGLHEVAAGPLFPAWRDV